MTVPRRIYSRRSLLTAVAVVLLLAAACDFQGSWSGAITTPAPTNAVATDDLRVASCIPSGPCVVAGRAAAQRGSSGWTALPTPPAEITALGCAAIDDCLGGWNNGALPTPTAAVYHFNGATWASTNWPTTYAPKSISCPSSTTCVVVGQNESGSVARRWNGSTFVALTLPTPTVLATGVSCSSTTFCLAVGFTSSIGPWAAKWTGGTSWTDVTTSNLTSALDRVSCQSATSCRVSARPGSDFQLASWNGNVLTGGPTSPFTDFITGWWSFTCGSGAPTRCFGVQSNSETHGNAIVGLVTASTELDLDFTHSVRDLACATATNCVAIGTSNGGSHAAWHFDGSSWSADPLTLPVTSDPHLSRISCPTSSSCMAIGTYAHGTRRRPYALVWNGTTWSPPATPLPFVDNDLAGVLDQDVTCLSATFCAVTLRTEDDTGEFPEQATTMYVWNGHTWAGQAGTAPVHLACFSTTSCIGLDYGASYSWDGTTVTHTQQSSLTVDFDRLSCATPTRCAAVILPLDGALDPNQIATWDGTTLVRSNLPAPQGQAGVVTDVSCVGTAPTRCVAVGAVGPIGQAIDTAGTPYALTDDGSGSWTPAPLPASGPGQLRAVSCPDTAECLTVGTGTVSGAAKPELMLALTSDTWKVAPDLPTSPRGTVQYESIACVPGWCGTVGQTGPIGDRDAIAATYTWTYS
jgi:hypothetical protein